MCRSLSVKAGTSASSFSQARAKAARSASFQCVCAIVASGIAVRSIGRSSRTRRSTSPSSSIRLGAGTCTAARPDWALTSSTARESRGAFEGVGEREGVIALAPADGEDLRLGTGLRMDVERPPVGHDQAFGRERLDADVIGARGDRAFDPGAQQILEHAEQRVLQIDGQRQQPVEESGDRRQVLTQGSVLVGQAQPGGILERLERAAFDLAANSST